MAKAQRLTPDGLTIIKMLEGNAKRYEALGWMTLTIRKVAKANNAINLEKAFDGSKKDKNVLLDQLRVALGLFEEKWDGKIGPTEATEEFFVNSTKRTNFANMLKKCAQAAAGLIDMKARVKMDDEKGTLVISGPAVIKEFGKSTVTLDERWAEGLTQKPSYTAITSIAKAKRRIVAVRGSNTRGAGAVISPESEFERLCATLIQEIRRRKGKLTKRQANALRAVSSAIEEALGSGEVLG